MWAGIDGRNWQSITRGTAVILHNYHHHHHDIQVFSTRKCLNSISTRDSICFSAYMPWQFRLPSVRPFDTRVHCIKPADHIIEMLSLSDRPIILVFRQQGLLRKSDGFSTDGRGRRGSDFQPICGYISYIHTCIFVYKKVDKRNLNMHAINYIIQLGIQIYSSEHGTKN